MRILAVRERTIPISSAMSNAVISFAEMTVSALAIITDETRGGRAVVGYGFNSNGRYAPSGTLRDRMIPRLIDAGTDLVEPAVGGFGGQLDFIRGAARSKGGVPIIALPSTAMHGDISRIVPMLDPGAGVVTSRADVHYVVTEHGIAYRHGKTLRERAEALIAISDPRFREELEEFAMRAHYMERRRNLSAFV